MSAETLPSERPLVTVEKSSTGFNLQDFLTPAKVTREDVYTTLKFASGAAAFATVGLMMF